MMSYSACDRWMRSARVVVSRILRWTLRIWGHTPRTGRARDDGTSSARGGSGGSITFTMSAMVIRSGGRPRWYPPDAPAGAGDQAGRLELQEDLDQEPVGDVVL